MFWNDITEQQMNAERLHYTVIRHLADNNDFNAVKYLYDRLNIIDAKAQGLLTRNSLLLTVVSILGAVKLRGDAHADKFLALPLEQFAFLFGFLLLLISTLSTLSLMFLQFDHITEVPPKALARMRSACSCIKDGKAVDIGSIPSACADREQCALARVTRDQLPRKHTLRDYEELFFEITIARQQQLRFGQRATIFASVVFFILIGYIFWDVMDHLHFHFAEHAADRPSP